MNNRDFRRVQALVGHPEFQRFCADFAAQAGVEIPQGTNPAGFVIANLHQEDPGLATAFVGNMVQVHEQVHGAPREVPGDAHDWDRDLPPAEVLKAWKALPEHSRLRQSAKSPQAEAIARRDLMAMGGQTLPGLTPGETMAAYLSYAGKHSKALASGDRAVYDSLAQRLGGALGDGEAMRKIVNEVKQIHYDDHVLHRIAEKTRVAEAEAAKHRAKPVENPTYHPKKIPQGALRPKEKPADTTRAEVARQYERQKAGWDMAGRRRPEKLRTEINDPDRLATAMALLKVKGESYDRLRIGPSLLKRGVQELREKGYEPAMASSSRGNSSARNWVQAPPSSFSSGESYPSGGSSGSDSYSGGGGTSGGEASSGEGGAP